MTAPRWLLALRRAGPLRKIGVVAIGTAIVLTVFVLAVLASAVAMGFGP